MSVLVILLVLVGINALINVVLHVFALKGLQCSRSFSVPAAHEGETAEVIEVVRNDRPLIVPWLRLESRISSHLHFGRQENLGVSGEMYHRSLFMLMPYQQITRRHKVRLALFYVALDNLTMLIIGKIGADDLLGKSNCHISY